MRIHKGYVLGLLGLLILASSLVLSTPFGGHTETKTRRTRPPTAPESAKPMELRTPRFEEDLDLGSLQTALPSVQETGPILFKEGELETYLTFPVPVGKRMIIDSVSARTEMSPGQTAAVTMTATSGGGTASFALPMAYQGRYEKLGDVASSALRLRAYADGGSVVTFRINRSAIGEQASGFVSLTGLLESR